MPVPPFVRRRLRITLRRVFPLLLPSQRGYVEIVPSVPHLLIAATVDEVGSKNLLAVADECIRAVPLVHAKVFVETIRDGVPRHLPTHPRLHALDVRLRRTRSERERRVASVQMREVCNLVGHEGTAAAGMLGPTKHARLEERAVDDQLTPAFEQIEQAHLAARPFELVLVRHRQPRHSPALGCQHVTGAGQCLLLHEKLLTRSLPLFRRYERGCLHCDTLFSMLHIFLVVLLHVSLLVLCCSCRR